MSVLLKNGKASKCGAFGRHKKNAIIETYVTLGSSVSIGTTEIDNKSFNR
jgi:hypothetical protein